MAPPGRWCCATRRASGGDWGRAERPETSTTSWARRIPKPWPSAFKTGAG
jgi:hypothetical protein